MLVSLFQQDAVGSAGHLVVLAPQLQQCLNVSLLSIALRGDVLEHTLLPAVFLFQLIQARCDGIEFSK
ncbi:hypothetical protein D9M70_452960 [compost metagenome]